MPIPYRDDSKRPEIVLSRNYRNYQYYVIDVHGWLNGYVRIPFGDALYGVNWRIPVPEDEHEISRRIGDLFRNKVGPVTFGDVRLPEIDNCEQGWYWGFTGMDWTDATIEDIDTGCIKLIDQIIEHNNSFVRK